MYRRTYDGMVGYVDGYKTCFQQFAKYLERYDAERARLKMELLVMAVEDVMLEPMEGATMRNRCCCNCSRNIRTEEADGYVRCNCEIDGHYIGYVECFEGWCRRWASDEKKWQTERSEK